MISAIFAPRLPRKHGKLTISAVFSLSIAMALGILSLSISNTAILLPPAAPDPDRLLTIHGRAPETEIDQISWLDYKYYRSSAKVFSDIAAVPNSISLLVDSSIGGRETKAAARPVSANYFNVLGIRPWLGRYFAPGDDETNSHSAVMTYSFWKRLGADRGIVGKRFAGYTIVGVTPREFTGSFYGVNGDLFTQLADGADTTWLNKRDERRFFLLGRLKPGASKRQAQTEMTALSRQLAQAYPKEDKNRTTIVTRATLLPPDAIPTAQLAAGILIGLVSLVLLIACANVANLLLALAVGRRQEAAIKMALGAPRGRLIREFLRESSFLCIVAAALGYGIAAGVIARFSDFTVDIPMFGAYSFALNLHLDFTVLAFTLALVLMASLASGLPPALHASSPDIAQILSGEVVLGGTGKGLRRNALAAGQIAICTLVLVGLGLCQRNLYNLRHADLGFTARNLVAKTAYFASEGYSEARGKELYSAIRKAVAALPGVQSVGMTSDLPLLGESEVPVQPPGGGKSVSMAHAVVDEDYFSTFGISVLQGRAFNSADRDKGMEVVVINRKMAETFWPAQDPLGKAVLAGDPATKFTVVGVVADGKYGDLDEPRRPFLYYALSQHYQPSVTVVARTGGDPRLWVEPMDHAFRALGLNAPIRPVTFEHWLNISLLTERITAAGVGALSALGLLLAAIGLAGTVAYSVSQRKRELGIRVALGARSGQLVRMILRQVLPVAGTGVVIGTLLGVGATFLLQSQFYQIAAVEWTVLVPVSAAMLAISLVVAYFSARPWIDADPMEAVRHN